MVKNLLEIRENLNKNNRLNKKFKNFLNHVEPEDFKDK